MAKWETFKLKRSTKCFYLFLSIDMSYYQKGCKHSELTKSKCSLVDLSEI
jgi:hypothetical protein